MAVTGVSPELRKPLIREVARIINSEVLRGSESLCQLLEYLAHHSVDEQGSSIKEHRIATEVFGRPADFDPRLDSTVRVQTSRLRSKLVEYYAGPGAHDEVIVEIPRGAYSVSVHARPARIEAVPEIRPAEVGPTPPRDPYRIAALVLSVFCCFLLASLVYVAHGREPAAGSGTEVPAGLKAFWHVFMSAPERTWVVFSNAEFVGRPETGLRYFDPQKDKGEAIFDHYTGIGEVGAIHLLDELFTQFGHGVLVKRGRLLALDDVKNNDVIFVGSPSENLTLRDLPAIREFQFRRLDSGSRKGDLGIFNAHPATGEDSMYYTTQGLPVTEDYAVISLMHGPTAQHWVMTLAGISTFGTQAAVEYVCDNTNVEQLLKRVKRAGSEVSPFEAMIRVNISRGVPVSSQLLSVRIRNL